MFQGLQIFLPGILIPDGFGPHGLVLLEAPLHRLKAEPAAASQGVIHSPKLLRESVPDILPKDTVLTVEDVRAVQTVGVLKVVIKDKLALVVYPKGRVEVVGEREPVCAVEGCGEEVLCPAVHHEKHFGEQVVK